MATGNNPSTQPALQVFALGPALSIVDGAPHFQFGECILVRIPLPLQINEHLDVNPEILASGLPPTSNNTSPQHFAFIRSLQLVPSGWLLEVFPIVSFTDSGGALEGYRRLSDAAKETLIPLPAFSHQHLTPALFGDPLTIDGYSNPRPSFLHIVPRIFVFDEKRSFKRMIPPVSLSLAQLRHIDKYRNTLRMTREAPDGDEQAQIPSSGGSGGANTLSGGSGQKGTSQGGREVGTGRVSNTDSLQTLVNVGSGGGNVAAQEDFSYMTPDGVLILEGVDEDSGGEDCTWKDQLIMLAHGGDPTWTLELRKYLQKEREEEVKLQGQRMERLSSWLQLQVPT